MDGEKSLQFRRDLAATSKTHDKSFQGSWSRHLNYLWLRQWPTFTSICKKVDVEIKSGHPELGIVQRQETDLVCKIPKRDDHKVNELLPGNSTHF